MHAITRQMTWVWAKTVCSWWGK